MNRRDFLKNALTFAALAPLARLIAREGADGDKIFDLRTGSQVSRRRFRNTALTVPLLGFGMMRLPQKNGGIDSQMVRKMFDAAMKAGCNYFDTAYMYHGGDSEKIAGELLRKYPRDSYYLTSKMPSWIAGSEKGVERLFQEQLERCKTEYFDFYMLHALDATNWELSQKYRALDFLKEMKKQGKIRRLGFSFHDTPEVLQTIVKAHDWDFAQIQLNYLDWELYRSKEQYEILTKEGIPVIVMEPLRGGSLSSLTPEATAILRKSAPEASNSAWALRYVASLPNVLCVLSGMTLMEHLQDNLKTFSPLKPLSEPERKVLEEALAAYRKRLAVPCTACKYCIPCPVGVEIPRIFGIYNQYKINGNQWLFRNNYNAIPADARASECVSCGKCAKHCPQKINIPAMLHKIAGEVK
ncbi:MAG: aldo/keto reductase [Victivallaceae bacterium]|nr:aldo/keto reductase [Victivallaceae bacterium]